MTNFNLRQKKSKTDSIPYLDIEIKLSEVGDGTQVYRKETNTGKILHYNSVAENIWQPHKRNISPFSSINGHHLSNNKFKNRNRDGVGIGIGIG